MANKQIEPRSFAVPGFEDAISVLRRLLDVAFWNEYGNHWEIDLVDSDYKKIEQLVKCEMEDK